MDPAACRCVDCLWEEIRNGPEPPQLAEARARRRLPLDMTLKEAKEVQNVSYLEH